MNADALMEGMPDLLVLLRRDGVVLECGGGAAVGSLRPAGECNGRRLESLWSPALAETLRLLLRRALTERTSAETRFDEGGRSYEARVSPQGPERALCVIRAATAIGREDTLDATDERPRPQLDRRGFLRRCKESMATAALRERPLAIAVIQLDGITDIAQILATKLAEQIMSTAILRLPISNGAADGKPWWYLG